jgi:hypothetical protein
MIGGEPVAGREVVAGRPWSGRSLAGLFEDWTATERDRVVVAGEAAAAVVTPTWHAVMHRPRAGSDGSDGSDGADGRVRVFAKPDDYFDLVDIADRRPALAEWLENAMSLPGGGFLSKGIQPGLWLDPPGKPGDD